jgi:predicted PurR-regulated permease PerM
MVICLSTWPLYQYLNKAVGDKPVLTSLLMIGLLIMLIIIPSALLAINLGSNVTASIEAVKVFLEHGPIKPPAWLTDLPLFGARLDSY